MSRRLLVSCGLSAALACSVGATGQASGAVPPPPPPVDVAGLPHCTTAVAPAPALPRVRTATVATPPGPFDVVVSRDGKWSFVTSLPRSGGSISVYRNGPFAPRAVRTIPRPEGVTGGALTPDGRYLLAADGSGAVVIDVRRAVRGAADPVVGTLTTDLGGGAIETAVSPDGAFAFVTEENSADLVVFDLRKALRDGFGPSDVVGAVPLHINPVGMAISPGGRWMYATSEANAPADPRGTLSIIDLREAERHPATAVKKTIFAGCIAVRVISSADGRTVWVTARDSDAVLGFSAAKIMRDPAHSLAANVRVGEGPVGALLVDHGRRLLLADSDRFNVSGASPDLAVVDTAAALGHRPAFLGRIATGLFPRQLALEPNGRTALLTNFASQGLEAIDVTGLP